MTRKTNPSKKSIKLKKNNAANQMPLSINSEGKEALNNKENPQIAQNHFKKLFARPPSPSEEKL